VSQRQLVCIIGGGLAGMTSALILARNGHDVTLVEKSPCLGLTVRGFTQQGTYFDTGLHYTGGLSQNGIVSRYLRYLGIDGLEVLSFKEDGFDEVRFADIGKIVRLPIGFERMSAALCEQFPGEDTCITRYMEAARTAFDESSLLRLFLTPQGKPQSGASESLAAFLAKYTENVHLRAVLSIHSLLYGASPNETPFNQHAYIAASYFDSVHNFSGGGYALVKAMERRLEEENVTIVLGKGVTRLKGDGTRLSHVELEDGSLIQSDAAICTTSTAALAAMGKDMFRPVYTEHLLGLEETCSANMLFGIAEKRPACLDGRNLFLCRDADLNRAFVHDTNPEDGPFFIASSPQPDGREENVGVIVVGPGVFADFAAWENTTKATRPESYKEYKTSVMQRIRDSVVAMCPELASVRFVAGATPLTLRDYLRAPRGGLYGSKHSIHQINPMPVTRLPNLFLAGQSIIAPGLMGAMISAFLACGLLLGNTKLHEAAACS